MAAESRSTLDQLQAGDKIEVDHELKVGLKVWHTVTRGTVLERRRQRNGMHFRRNADDKVFRDEILLQRDDGELTTVTCDEFTRIRKLNA